MRTLYLLRHAKFKTKDETLADFERPLARPGRKACRRIARFIKENHIDFDLVLTSTAIVARDTIDLIVRRANLQGELRFDERIHEASVPRLLEIISQIESDRKTVLLVGHNPGFEELLHGLTQGTHRLPSAALAKINLKIVKWSDRHEGRAALEWIVTPKQLKESHNMTASRA